MSFRTPEYYIPSAQTTHKLHITQGITPVSYTHLDVYKRQTEGNFNAFLNFQNFLLKLSMLWCVSYAGVKGV